LQGQRLFLCKLPIRDDSIDKVAECGLVVTHNPARTVFDHLPFKIDRPAFGRRQFDPCGVLDHPADFLQILPSPPAGSSRGFQFLQHPLEIFGIQRHREI
jgi:hypothetical protein